MNVLFIKTVMLLGILIATVAHFILLVMKSDRNADFSYIVVALPAIIVYIIGGASMFFVSICWFFSYQRWINGLQTLAVAILAIGSFWTQVYLARKFELQIQVTYLEAVLPFLISLSASIIIMITHLRLS